MNIPPPLRDQDHPDRNIDCQIALTRGFEAIRDAGIEAGWSPAEVAFALLCLAVAEVRGQEEDMKTEEAIARAVRSVGEP